jgi:hypothetical protein
MSSAAGEADTLCLYCGCVFFRLVYSVLDMHNL